MRHLLNTLFVTLEDAYATLDGENIVVKQGDNVGRTDFLCISGRASI